MHIWPPASVGANFLSVSEKNKVLERKRKAFLFLSVSEKNKVLDLDRRSRERLSYFLSVSEKNKVLE